MKVDGKKKEKPVRRALYIIRRVPKNLADQWTDHPRGCAAAHLATPDPPTGGTLPYFRGPQFG